MNTGRRQGHYQNSFKFTHNPNSKLTKKIADIEHDCLCDKCAAVVNWRKDYRKYKLLKDARRCNSCQERTVIHSYHIVCDSCARSKGVCAKCNTPCDAANAPKKVTDEEVQNALSHSGLKERLKRSLVRNWENGLLLNEDMLTIITADANGSTIDWKMFIQDYDEDESSDDDAKDMGVERPKVVIKKTVKKIVMPKSTKATKPENAHQYDHDIGMSTIVAAPASSAPAAGTLTSAQLKKAEKQKEKEKENEMKL